MVWQVWGGGLLPILVLLTAAWAVSVVRRDVSILDRVWGPATVLAAVTYALLGDGAASRTTLVLTLVGVWALHRWLVTGRRGRGTGEPERYRVLRDRRPDAFAITSLYRLFWPHAGLLWLISLPLAAALHRPAPEGLGLFDVAGALVWVAGFVVGVIGDGRRVGVALVWWGLFLLALATGAWWAVLGPVLVTALAPNLRPDGGPVVGSGRA